MRWGLACVGWVGVAMCFAACATGTADEDVGASTQTTSSSSGATSGAGGMGSGGADASSSSSSSSTSTSGGGGMGGVMCTPPEHLCGGICVGNTVETGCTSSVDCSPCPQPTANGTATCTTNGACSLECDMGYTAVGNDCVCATECCSESDCASGEVCTEQGQCTSDCQFLSNPEGFFACQAICAILNQSCVSSSCSCQ